MISTSGFSPQSNKLPGIAPVMISCKTMAYFVIHNKLDAYNYCSTSQSNIIILCELRRHVTDNCGHVNDYRFNDTPYQKIDNYD